MKLRQLIILLFCAFIILNCEKKQEFDFTKKWTWEELQNFSRDDELTKKINQLSSSLSIEEAQFIFEQITTLKKPEDIKKLSSIETEQQKWGGGFYGYIPNFFQNTKTIPVPINFGKTIETGLFLSYVRNKIHRAILFTEFKYQMKFRNKQIEKAKEYEFNSDLKLEINTSAVKKVIEFYNGNINMSKAEKIANNHIFREMLQDRRNLGVIPEPLPEADDLAKFIYNSGSTEPLHKIWKWLNPCNYFCFADLYVNRENYKKLISKIDNNKKDLELKILHRIDRYIPDNTQFSHKIYLGVNWGVRTWTAPDGIGSNIVQLKDNFPTFIRSMRHEIFHQVQVQICPVSPDLKGKEDIKFSDMSYWNFDDKSDQKFYEILSYIFYEGTATYVGGKPANWLVIDGVKESMGMLDQIYVNIYKKNNISLVEQIMKMGMQSNGPFYALGYLMTRTIEKNYGIEELKKAIKNGPLYFFKKFYEHRRKNPKRKLHYFSDEAGEKIIQLYKKMLIFP